MVRRERLPFGGSEGARTLEIEEAFVKRKSPLFHSCECARFPVEGEPLSRTPPIAR